MIYRRYLLSFTLLLLNLSLPYQSLMAAFLQDNVTALIPRGDAKVIQVTIELRSIGASDLQEVSANDFTTTAIRNLLYKNLDVCFNATECNAESRDKIQYTGNPNLDDDRATNGSNDDNFDDVHVITVLVDSINSQPSDGSNLIEDATIVFKIEQINYSTDFQAGTDIALRYGTGEDRTATTSLSSVTKTEPKGAALFSQNEGLLVTWTKQDTVKDANDNSSPPRGMRAYLIPQSDQNSESKLVMNNFDGSNPSAETPTYNCQLVFSEDDPLNGCTFSCTNGEEIGYLNDEAMQSAYSGIIIQEERTLKNSILFTGLSDIEQVYAVILQYLPEGSRSNSDTSCLAGSSKKTYTYAQLTGGREPKLGDPKCFIATAAYGTPWHQDIDALRWWRDHVLHRLPGGQSIIRLYYEWSPPIAKMIASNEDLKHLTRIGLYPIVQGAKISQSSPWLGLVLLIAILAGGTKGLLILVNKFRGSRSVT